MSQSSGSSIDPSCWKLHKERETSFMQRPSHSLATEVGTCSTKLTLKFVLQVAHIMKAWG